ncbi:MAG: pilus assembly protein [Sedimentisphaerales bacterium]|nr:pilus assembly protein [Sedimentisphaerales bacterium]
MGYLHNNKGGAAVEFVICLPILLILLGGSIEFGLMFYNKQIITNASREGVRAGITGDKTVDDIKNIVLTYCNGQLINLNGANELQADLVNISGPDAENDLTVRVTYNYDLLFAGIMGLNQKTLSAQTIMRME